MTRPRAVSQTALPRRIAQCIALVMVIGTLTVLGCSKSSSSDAPVTASDLTNRSFAFTSGAGPDLATELKLPQGQAFTLQFGNFGGTNVGPVTLDSGGSAASGTVNLASGSCIFHFDRSTFPAGHGPQSDEQLTPSACQINRTDNTLRLTATSGENRVSAPAIPLPTTNVALVLTTDVSIGSYSVVDLALRSVFKDIKVGGVHSDAIARFVRTADFVNPSAFPTGRVYVVNRLGADNIQILDPQLGFITPTNGTLSVGTGTNAQDIVFVPKANKAYVSRLGSPKLLIIDPITLRSTGELDLSSLVKPNDSNGSPGPASMRIFTRTADGCGTPGNCLVYVALQHQGARGEAVVIDPTTDRIVSVITLKGTNPASEFQFSPDLNRILISSVGDFAVDDGGIEAINPDTNAVDPQFAITEATMGGDITAFVIVSRTKGYAIVSDATFANSLITFDPSSGERLNRLVGPLNVIMAHLAINSRNEVYVAVVDTTIATSGLRIFDANTDNEITSMPLNVGQLPPVFTVFAE
jgi:hypothetical protein